MPVPKTRSPEYAEREREYRHESRFQHNIALEMVFCPLCGERLSRIVWDRGNPSEHIDISYDCVCGYYAAFGLDNVTYRRFVAGDYKPLDIELSEYL